MMFAPLIKAEQASQTIWARAAAEEPDKAREIMDYVSARPQFETWSGNFAKATLGKSFGNIRAMHNPRHLAGKVQEIRYNDAAKAIDVCVKVLDPVDWRKVEEGGYTGLSIGGGYVRKWKDPGDPTLTRYTPRIAEISLVDAPCIPSARFLELQKRDGSVEEVPLIGHARTFAEMLPPPSFNDLRKALLIPGAGAIAGWRAGGRVGEEWGKKLATRHGWGGQQKDDVVLAGRNLGRITGGLAGLNAGAKIAGLPYPGEISRDEKARRRRIRNSGGYDKAVPTGDLEKDQDPARRGWTGQKDTAAMTQSDASLLVAIDDRLEKAGWGAAAAGIGRRLRGAAQGGAAHLAGRAMPHLEAAADAAGPHIQRGLQAGRRGVAAATHPYRTLEERVADKATLRSFNAGKTLSTPERVARGRKWGHAARYGLRAGLGAGAAGAGAYALSGRGAANKMADDPVNLAIEARLEKLLLPALVGYGGFRVGRGIGRRLGAGAGGLASIRAAKKGKVDAMAALGRMRAGHALGGAAGGVALGIAGWRAGRRVEGATEEHWKKNLKRHAGNPS